MWRVAGIGIERIDRHQRRDAADLGLEIAPAGADRVRDAAAGARDQAGDLLDAGARRADDADVAARHDVGEGERHAADDRGAAIGPHHQTAQRARLLLQRDLVGDRDVVGEDHHVEAARSALRASAAAKSPGTEISARLASGICLRAARMVRGCQTLPAPPSVRGASSWRCGLGERGVGGGAWLARSADDQVAGPAASPARRRARRPRA